MAARSAPILPEGFRYGPQLITSDEERALLERFADLPFRPFEFQGYVANRRVLSYGWRYDFSTRELNAAEPIPDFLLPARDKAAGWAGFAPEALGHVLLIEYAPGAGIGWHRDRPEFGDVIGISLLASCSFRLRRRAGTKWERASVTAEPRSAYLLSGTARTVWEHSIPSVETLRYSITFRTLR